MLMQKKLNDSGKDRTAAGNKKRVAEIIKQTIAEFEAVEFSNETAELLEIYTQQRSVTRRLMGFVATTQTNQCWKYTNTKLFCEACQLPTKLIADVLTDFVLTDAERSETAAAERTKYEQARKGGDQ